MQKHMKNMILAALVAISLVLPAKGEEPKAKIEGAFGLKLGDKFDVSKATWTRTLDDGDVLYGFQPTKPFKGMHDYYVSITPDESLIYTISALQKFDSATEAQAECDVICHILENKYGPFDKPRIGETMSGIKRIMRDHRIVQVDLDKAFAASVQIVYVDLELFSDSEKKKIASKAAQVDASGL